MAWIFLSLGFFFNFIAWRLFKNKEELKKIMTDFSEEKFNASMKKVLTFTFICYFLAVIIKFYF
jgi:hypothetical protein